MTNTQTVTISERSSYVVEPLYIKGTFLVTDTVVIGLPANHRSGWTWIVDFNKRTVRNPLGTNEERPLKPQSSALMAVEAYLVS